MIRDRNISAETFIDVVADPEPYLDNTKYSIVEVSDDKKYNKLPHRSYAIFTREFEGILTVLCRKTMDARDYYKKLLKDQSIDKVTKKRYDQLQLNKKVKGNSFYGASGAKTNPYYMRIVGCAITAYARHCLAQLSRAMHSLYGFAGGEALEEGEPMIWALDPKFKKNKKNQEQEVPYKW